MDMALPLAVAPQSDQLTYKVMIDSVTIPVPPAIGTDDNAVRRAVSAFYPGAETARIDRTEKDGVVSITLVKVPGRKGNGSHQQYIDNAITSLVTCQGGINPAVDCFIELRSLDLAHLSPVDQIAIKKKCDLAIDDGGKQAARLLFALKLLSNINPREVPVLITGF